MLTIKMTRKELKARRHGGAYFAQAEEDMMWMDTIKPKTMEEAKELVGFDLCKIDLEGFVAYDERGDKINLKDLVGIAVIDTDKLKLATLDDLFEVELVLKYDFKREFKAKFEELAKKHYILDMANVFSE